ncbi:hypothetical protein GLOTRDRAFT_93893 [Gloeophyllum trabeum ATCC 11539]|uniref:Uncharacterized protein n=1 Tax=Gloeophyllum trabeum (strain ATCC 11539 / FP-39264 / Madison 617) TaxID=670483 RepID=S7RR91_GLOTA|nr:uncharacterized protein GLOTRDRAFT_93893 [Gloeophyllum trabeum ATCC 11539]EPQ55449.1 hypothetical protein GLOTRDRAFT_93893 [Gloeophyllum trabeum ATCC 11539]
MYLKLLLWVKQGSKKLLSSGFISWPRHPVYGQREVYGTVVPFLHYDSYRLATLPLLRALADWVAIEYCTISPRVQLEETPSKKDKYTASVSRRASNHKQARLTEELQIIEFVPPPITSFPKGIYHTKFKDEKLTILDDIASAIATGECNEKIGVAMEERGASSVHFILAVNGLPSSREEAAAERFIEALLYPGDHFVPHMLEAMRSYAMPRIARLSGQVAESIEQASRTTSYKTSPTTPGVLMYKRNRFLELENASVPEALTILLERLRERTSEVHQSADNPSFPTHDAMFVNGLLVLAHHLSEAPIFNRLIRRSTRAVIVLFVGGLRYKLAMLGRYHACLERLRTLAKRTEMKITYEWCTDDVAGIVNDRPVVMRRSALEVIKAAEDRATRIAISVSDSTFGKICSQYKPTLTVSTHPTIRLILKLGSTAQTRLVGCSGGVCYACSEWISRYNDTHPGAMWTLGPSLQEVDSTWALTHRFPFEEDVYQSIKEAKEISLIDWLDPSEHDQTPQRMGTDSPAVLANGRGAPEAHRSKYTDKMPGKEQLQERLTEELQILHIIPRLTESHPPAVDTPQYRDQKLQLLDDIAMAVSTGEPEKTVAVTMEERGNGSAHFLLAVNGQPAPSDEAAVERFFEALCGPEERFEERMMNAMRSYAIPRIARLAKQVADATGEFVQSDFMELLEGYRWSSHEVELPGFRHMKKLHPELQVEGVSVPDCLITMFKYLREATGNCWRSVNNAASSTPAYDVGRMNWMIVVAYHLAHAPILNLLLNHRDCRRLVFFLGSFRYRLATLGRYYGCLNRLQALVTLSKRNISYEWCRKDAAGVTNNRLVAIRRSHLEVITADIPDWRLNSNFKTVYPELIFGGVPRRYKQTITVSTHPAIRLILSAPQAQLQLVGCSEGVCLTTEAWIREYNKAENTSWKFGPSLRDADPTFALTHRYAFEGKVYEMTYLVKGGQIEQSRRVFAKNNAYPKSARAPEPSARARRGCQARPWEPVWRAFLTARLPDQNPARKVFQGVTAAVDLEPSS